MYPNPRIESSIKPPARLTVAHRLAATVDFGVRGAAGIRMTPKRALMGAALLLVLAGCPGGEDGPSPTSSRPADLAGRWAFEVQATSTTCTGLEVPTTVGTGYYEIVQSGSTLSVGHLDECGELVYAAPGTVSGSVALIVFEGRVCPDLACCYDVQVTETLTLSEGDLGGDVRFTITTSGCGTTVMPCEYTGTVLAAECSPGACQSYPPTCS